MHLTSQACPIATSHERVWSSPHEGGESVNDYFLWALNIAKKMKDNGEKKGVVAVVEKIMRSMALKFDYDVSSIEESNDTNAWTIDELQSSMYMNYTWLLMLKKSTLVEINLQNEDKVIEDLDDKEEDETGDTIDKDLTNSLWSAIVVINSDISDRNVQANKKAM